MISLTLAMSTLQQLRRLRTFQRNMGKDVFFLTGTDEHGLKVEQSAEKRGVGTQQLADENSALFREVMDDMNISYTSFIRTTNTSRKSRSNVS